MRPVIAAAAAAESGMHALATATLAVSAFARAIAHYRHLLRLRHAYCRRRHSMSAASRFTSTRGEQLLTVLRRRQLQRAHAFWQLQLTRGCPMQRRHDIAARCCTALPATSRVEDDGADDLATLTWQDRARKLRPTLRAIEGRRIDGRNRVRFSRALAVRTSRAAMAVTVPGVAVLARLCEA